MLPYILFLIAQLLSKVLLDIAVHETVPNPSSVWTVLLIIKAAWVTIWPPVMQNPFSFVV